MKTAISTIKLLLLIILVGGFIVLGFPALKNKLFYSHVLVPEKIFTLNDQINSGSPQDTLENRTVLLQQIDNLAKKSVSGSGFSSGIYSLVKIRLDQALKEIPTTIVPQGKVRIWYIYNMGIIVKSADKTIAFDLAGTYTYSDMAGFAKYIDILVITHFDGDHFDLAVVKESLKNGATVIIPDDKMIFKGQEFGRDPNGENAVSLIKKRNNISSNNLISLQPLEKTTINSIEITAYPSLHLHNPDEEAAFVNPPVNWYYVNLSGITLLHTGDGAGFDFQPNFTNKPIDVYIIHSTTLDPLSNENLMKLVPYAKTILPLHVLELGHGSNIVDPKHLWYMNYQSILDNYANGYYQPLLTKAKFMPLIWGESFSL